jgi:hypothetical protein
MPSSQKISIFVCILLSACAAGVTGDEAEPPSPLVTEPASSAAGMVEAGSPSGSGLGSSPAENPTLAPVVVVTPPSSSQDAGAATAAPPASTSTSTSTLDAALPVSTLPEASLPSAVPDAASSRDSAATPATDAAREASAPAPSAPSCDPAQCDNECFLLARCCNAQNQCACFSVLRGTCSLPSL